MSASTHLHSCDQLGACQDRATPCSGCTKPTQAKACAYPYAPGAIEHHKANKRQQWIARLRKLQRALVWAFAITATAGIAGLVAGYITGA